MSNQDSETQKQLAVRIAASANINEKEAIRLWIEKLLALKDADLPAVQKAKQAISVTAESKNERGLKGRLGIGGAAAGLTLFGGQGAGVAALGTAIGVPLWVVFGAGAAFLGVLYEEIAGKKENPKTTFTVIDAERKDE